MLVYLNIRPLKTCNQWKVPSLTFTGDTKNQRWPWRPTRRQVRITVEFCLKMLLFDLIFNENAFNDKLHVSVRLN